MFVIIGAHFVKEELVINGKRNRAYSVEVPVSCAIEFIFAQKMMRESGKKGRGASQYFK